MMNKYFTNYFISRAAILAAVVMSLVVAPSLVFAQAQPVNSSSSTEETVDESGKSGFVICGNTVDTPCNVAHLFRAFIIIINYLITMAGFVAVLFIVIAGVQMTASQGQEGHKQAIQKLSGAIIGLVLVALAFVLVNSLVAGSLNLGIKQGALILSSPKEYINESENNSATPTTESNTKAPVTTPAPSTNKTNATVPKK